MNSVTIVSAGLRTSRSPIANAPQRRPKRSTINRAWPCAGDGAESGDHLLV